MRSRCALLAILTAAPLHAQSTQAYLAGTIADSITGLAVVNASVSCRNWNSATPISGRGGLSGRFTFAALSPGQYEIRVDAPGYQSQELHSLDLPISARLELEFHLRPQNDVWEARQYQSYLLPESHAVLSFYGPDLDTSRVASFETSHGVIGSLETSVSSVIDSRDLNELPLTGRDAYALLVMLPGVTADTATARGLGFSINGQRPSSANYLLDGLENNNLLVTGPLGIVAPEAVEEYRISTNNFSAEFGRTSGFLANAISRSGGGAWHGITYLHLRNAVLNANDFQENVAGRPRPPVKEIEPGFTASGPLRRNRLFISTSLDLLRFRSRQDPQSFTMPTAQFIASTDPAGLAGKLLREFPAAAVPSGTGVARPISIAPPSELDRAAGLARLDYLSLAGAHHLFARAALDRERQPGLFYDPYSQFSSPFHNGAFALGAGWTWQIGSSLTAELRAGRSGDATRYDRPHSEVPQLAAYVSIPDSTGGSADCVPFSDTPCVPVALPGSASLFGYRDLSQNWELVENFSWVSGRHTWKFGGGFFERTTESAFTEGQDGLFYFSSLSALVSATPSYLFAAYDRTAPCCQPVPYNRTYRFSQFDLFAQDALRVTPRLSVNYGIRYDYFGAPQNIGAAKDNLLALGPGANFVQRLQGLHFQPISAGNQALFDTDSGNLGARFGFSYALDRTAQTVLRGGYGIFYDRPFDNLWQIVSSNRQRDGVWTFSGPLTLLSPAILAGAQGIAPSSTELYPLQLFQPGLRNPMIQSAFLGVGRSLTNGVVLQVNALASRGRELWSTDLVNRFFSVVPSPANNNGRYNPNFEDIDYRANQGASDYAAFAATVRFHRSRLDGQASYTWSHSIDNQSDPLAGVFEDYNQSNLSQKPQGITQAAFTRQFDSHADRADSDFDQRHNLVVFAIYSIPSKLFRGWRVSGLGAVRSGLPFTVLAQELATVTSGAVSVNQRANIAAPALVYSPAQSSVPGGRALLNAAAFSTPVAGKIGNTGRNSFAGPGLVSADLSISRAFQLSRAHETRRATLRADFYNAFNHANLGNPGAYLPSANFGQALYGLEEKNSGFPPLTPFNETARQIQLFLRFEF